MIIPIRCFTCGKPIDNRKWNEYLELTREENREETIQMHSKILTRPLGQKAELPKEDITPEYVALNKLGVVKMCCRKMYLGTIDMFDKL